MSTKGTIKVSKPNDAKPKATVKKKKKPAAKKEVSQMERENDNKNLAQPVNKPCDFCGRESKIVESVCFCFDCNEKLCVECRDVHDKNTQLRKHNITDIDKVNEQNEEMLREIDRCVVHPDKKVKYYCIDDDAIFCSNCAIVKHRTCTVLDAIEDRVKDMEVNGGVSKLRQEIDVLLKHVKELKAHDKKLMKSLDVNKAQKWVQLQREKVMELFDNIEANIQEDSNRIRKEESQKVKKHNENCDEIESAMKDALKTLTNVRDAGTPIQIFVAIQRVTVELRAREKEVAILHEQANDVDIEANFFEARFDETLKEMERCFAVKLSLTEANIEKLPFEVPKPAPKLKPKPEPENKEKEIKFEMEVNVKTKHNLRQPRITGSLFLPDSRVVIIDRKNRQLKLFDPSFTMVGEEHFEEMPWSVVQMEGMTIAVSLNNNRIAMMEIDGNSIYLIKYISTNYSLCPLVITNDKEFAGLSNSGRSRLEMINMDGKTVSQSKMTFAAPLGLAFDKFRNVMYVSCRDENKMYAIDENDEVIFTFTDLLGPMGVNIDNDGNIYICSSRANEVTQLNKEGEVLRRFVTETNGVKKPLHISFNRDCSRFLVSSEDSDTIKIFRYN